MKSDFDIIVVRGGLAGCGFPLDFLDSPLLSDRVAATIEYKQTLRQ